MLDLKPVDCSSMDRFQIGPEIIKRIEEVEPENKILRLKILNLPMEVYKALDFNQLRKLTAAALYFELQYDVTKDDQDTQIADIRFELLGNEFKSFISNQAIEGLDKEKLTALGLDYLTAAGADISGEGEGMEE
jgi:hypothetical protein